MMKCVLKRCRVYESVKIIETAGIVLIMTNIFARNHEYQDSRSLLWLRIERDRKVGGGRSLHSTQHITSGTLICNYCDNYDLLTNDQYATLEATSSVHYGVFVKNNSIAVPRQVRDAEFNRAGQCTNLGILINAALPRSADLCRRVANCRLVVSQRLGRITISIRSIRDIRPGQEILISYGATFTRLLSKSIGQ
jgi:SET domain-containing protein